MTCDNCKHEHATHLYQTAGGEFCNICYIYYKGLSGDSAQAMKLFEQRKDKYARNRIANED